MSKYINIVILYQSNIHKDSKTNKCFAHIYIMDIYTTYKVGLPRFQGQCQGQTQVKTKYFMIPVLSSTNTITMFVFRKAIGEFYD